MMRVAILGGDHSPTRIVYHRLGRTYPDLRLILEEGVPPQQLIRKRIKKLGLLHVLGQLAFQVLIAPILRRLARERLRQITARFDLSDAPIDASVVTRVRSANSLETMQALAEYAPQVVVVSGTRILSAELLGAVPAIFINIHAGVTPRYRGVHGGYWALAQGDQQNAGVTVHLVDRGIDTGGIIEQARIETGPEDSFATYPLLQLATGLPLLESALRAVENGTLRTLTPGAEVPSRLWSHPTIFEYLWNRVKRGVK